MSTDLRSRNNAFSPDIGCTNSHTLDRFSISKTSYPLCSIIIIFILSNRHQHVSICEGENDKKYSWIEKIDIFISALSLKFAFFRKGNGPKRLDQNIEMNK